MSIPYNKKIIIISSSHSSIIAVIYFTYILSFETVAIILSKKFDLLDQLKIRKTKILFNCHLFAFQCSSFLYMAFLVAQSVKSLTAMLETWVRSLGWEDPLKKEMATHSSILAWKIAWAEEPGGLQSMGSQWVGHSWARIHAHSWDQELCIITNI